MMVKENWFFKIFPLFLVLISAQLLVISCGQNTITTTAPEITSEENKVEIISESASTIIIPSFYELASYSDIVIIGRIRSEAGVINTARDPKDNSKPDPRFFTVVQIYLVEVEKYIKGNGLELIYLGQKQGKFVYGSTPSPDEISQVRLSSANKIYTPLSSSKNYLMFLRSIEVWEDYQVAGLESGNLYVRTANPWLFDATDQKRVNVVEMLNGIEKMFPPKSLSAIIELMNNPEMIQPTTPYPGPLESPLNQSQPTISSYPEP